MTKATAARIGQDWEPYVQARAAAIPVARAGQPEDIAHTVSFLVSEGAGFVSGQVIYVAGGPGPSRALDWSASCSAAHGGRHRLRGRRLGALGVAGPGEEEGAERGDPEGDQGQQDLPERQLEDGAQRAVQALGLRRVEGDRGVAEQRADQRERDPLAGKPTCPSRVTSRRADGEASARVDLLQEASSFRPLRTCQTPDADEDQPGGADEELAARPAEDAGRGVLLLLRSWTGRRRWRT